MSGTYGKRDVIYPKADDERMQRVESSPEILIESGMNYFFSPGFKTSDIVIEHVLSKYNRKKEANLFKKMKQAVSREGIVTRFEFERNRTQNTKVQSVLSMLNQEKGEEKKAGNVLAYYEDTEGTENLYLITKDKLLSNYRDDNGTYTDVFLKDITLSEHGIYSLEGKQLVKGASFPSEFIWFFKEIRALGDDVKMADYHHPLREESIEIRKKYMEIMIDKSFDDDCLSANEVIRIEILARQLGISSGYVIQRMQDTVREKKSRASYPAAKKVNDIPEKYYYVLLHDLLVLDLLEPGDEIKENMSDFTETIADKCQLNKEFINEYCSVVQKLIKSSYEIGDMMENSLRRLQERSIVKNIFDVISFEYYVQEELVRR